MTSPLHGSAKLPTDLQLSRLAKVCWPGTGDPPRALQTLVRAVVVCAVADAAPGVAVVEAAAALGVLRAQQGVGPVAAVDDVLRLRAPLTAYLAAPGTDGASQERLADALDAALRSAADAFSAEIAGGTAAGGTRDPLSGLLTPTAFEEAVRREVATASRQGAPCLLLLEVAGLDRLGAVSGRLALDLAVLSLVELARSGSRGADVLGRVADHRLALLLPRTEIDAGRFVARRIFARATAEDPFANPSSSLALRVAVERLDAPASPGELLAAGDAVLARARRNPGHALDLGGAGAAHHRLVSR